MAAAAAAGEVQGKKDAQAYGGQRKAQRPRWQKIENEARDQGSHWLRLAHPDEAMAYEEAYLASYKETELDTRGIRYRLWGRKAG